MTRRSRNLVVAAAVLMAAAIGLGVQTRAWRIRGERVTFRSGETTLSGMIAFPRRQQGPFPAAVVVHGSGPSTWKDLRGYALRLTSRGIAVLMYDKRGVGRSGGTYSSIRIPDSEEMLSQLAADASAAVDALLHRSDIDATRVGLIGGSQAGWIMPLTAARHRAVAYFVSISGPAVSYGQEIHYSQLTGDDPGPYGALSDVEIERRLAGYVGPHGYDPLPTLATLDVPSLWILGGSDRSVPTGLTVANLERLRLIDATDIEIEVYPGADHSLRHVGTGRRIDYWPRILDWLDGHGFTGN